WHWISAYHWEAATPEPAPAHPPLRRLRRRNRQAVQDDHLCRYIAIAAQEARANGGTPRPHHQYGFGFPNDLVHRAPSSCPLAPRSPGIRAQGRTGRIIAK